jgi:hypothetical protein
MPAIRWLPLSWEDPRSLHLSPLTKRSLMLLQSRGCVHVCTGGHLDPHNCSSKSPGRIFTFNPRKRRAFLILGDDRFVLFDCPDHMPFPKTSNLLDLRRAWLHTSNAGFVMPRIELITANIEAVAFFGRLFRICQGDDLPKSNQGLRGLARLSKNVLRWPPASRPPNITRAEPPKTEK